MSSNHRDGPDYNNPPENPWAKPISAMGSTLAIDSLKKEIDGLRKELQQARAENESMMSTDYWAERYKDAKKECVDLKEWLVSKDEQIEHQINFGEFIVEQNTNMLAALIKISQQDPDGKRAREIATKAIKQHQRDVKDNE